MPVTGRPPAGDRSTGQRRTRPRALHRCGTGV